MSIARRIPRRSEKTSWLMVVLADASAGPHSLGHSGTHSAAAEEAVQDKVILPSEDGYSGRVRRLQPPPVPRRVPGVSSEIDTA